ncbi:MAG: hypothetical protein R3308_01225 [Thiohalobacterales bacterium]|nr:hypothetical protein [Thiohalobacterales bacterium]
MPRLLLLLSILGLLIPGNTHADNGPVERLAEAIRFRTISYQDQRRIDYD